MKMKKIIAVAIAGIFLIGFFVAAKSVIAASLEEIQNQLQSLLNQVNRLQLEVDKRQKANAESTLPAFNMTVRWGNVIGKATAEGKKAANFNGSVEIQGNGNINVSSSLFESGDNDRIISRTSAKVLWKSTTRGGWDGVKVRINNALPNDTIVIGTAQGTTTMTAQELYDLTSPSIQSAGEGREIVIEGTPKTRSSSSSFISSSSSSHGSSSSASSSIQHIPRLRFDMTVRWGNVIGKATAEGKKAANFNGSVEIQGATTPGSRIRLIGTRKFEGGRSNNDRIISRTVNKIIWKSTTYGGWDGVRVRISTSPNDTIVIGTAQGTTTMTAQELYDLTAPSIQSAGEGREIVIEGTPKMKLLDFDMTVRWGNVIGKATAEGKTQADFSGSIEIPNITVSDIRETDVRLIGGLRFEKGKSQQDRVFEDTNKIIWKSTTYGGWDGVKIRMRNVFPTDEIVIGTAQGTTTMTAQELYDLTAPSIQDVGKGREIVINGTPKTRSDRFLGSSSSSSSSLQGSSSSASSLSSSSSSASSADGSSSSSSSSLSSSSSVSSASSSSVSNSSSTSSAQ